MKRLFALTLMAIAAFVTISCDKDDAESGVVGTWQMRADEYHYFDATFNSDGTYVWNWMGASGGIKDEGTYTFENDQITMKATTMWEEDYENKGHYNKTSLSSFEWHGKRVVTVHKNLGGVAFWDWKGDFLIQDSENFRFGKDGVIVFKKGFDFKIKKSDLIGTWEEYNEDNSLSRRLIVEDGKFKDYSVWYNEDGSLCVHKEIGTWTLSSNVLSMKFTNGYSSYMLLGWNKETQQNDYLYYNVNPDTLEAEQWESYTYDYTQELYIYIDGNKVVSNMGTLFKKK
ncbi:MAG: hypothetical protein J5745_04850 [Bacteroidales bacterium]|nr:hypothetical protein [Bacteroidales bacterium]